MITEKESTSPALVRILEAATKDQAGVPVENEIALHALRAMQTLLSTIVHDLPISLTDTEKTTMHLLYASLDYSRFGLQAELNQSSQIMDK